MKLIRRKKRRIRQPILFAIPVVLYILTMLFLRTYNNSLTIKIQRCEREMAVLREENEKINKEIIALTSKDRIMAIAEENGMEIDLDRVVNLVNEKNSPTNVTAK